MKKPKLLRDLLVGAIGVAFGYWAANLHRQEGWAGLLREGWVGLLVALGAVGLVTLAFRRLR